MKQYSIILFIGLMAFTAGFASAEKDAEKEAALLTTISEIDSEKMAVKTATAGLMAELRATVLAAAQAVLVKAQDAAQDAESYIDGAADDDSKEPLKTVITGRIDTETIERQAQMLVFLEAVLEIFELEFGLIETETEPVTK